MMKNSFALLVLSTAALAISACSRETNFARSFYAEAGSEIETNDLQKVLDGIANNIRPFHPTFDRSKSGMVIAQEIEE